MIRTKGEAELATLFRLFIIARTVNTQLKKVLMLDKEELMTEAKNLGAPYELLLEIKKLGRLPVVNFAAGGIATPADAALMMQIGVDGVFVGSGILNPAMLKKSKSNCASNYSLRKSRCIGKSF